MGIKPYYQGIHEAMTVEATEFSDRAIIERIANNDEEAYASLFRQFYVQLCRFSLKYVRAEAVSEEIVQEVFISLWEKRESLNIHSSLKAYLFQAVKNSSINYLNSQFAKQDFQRDYFDHSELPVNNTQETLIYDELQKVVQQAIDYLPPKCRTIYALSRNTGMSYKEIADELGVSIKTVEAQMGIALKKLRTYLQHHWELLTLLILINGGIII